MVAAVPMSILVAEHLTMTSTLLIVSFLSQNVPSTHSMPVDLSSTYKSPHLSAGVALSSHIQSAAQTTPSAPLAVGLEQVASAVANLALA